MRFFGKRSLWSYFTVVFLSVFLCFLIFFDDAEASLKTISVESVSGESGERVRIDVIASNIDMAGFQFLVEYNNEQLLPVDAGLYLNQGSLTKNLNHSPGKMSFMWFTSSNVRANKLFWIEFDIIDDFEGVSAPLIRRDESYNSVNDDSLKELEITYISGSFSLSLECNPPEAGSLTGSGRYPANYQVPVNTEASEGFEFIDWSRENEAVSGLSAFNFTMPETAVTLVANYRKLEYAVIFLDYDDSVIKEVNISHGEAAEAPESPEREGYSFTGWDISFGNVTSTLTVKALYEINRYTLYYRSDGNGYISGEEEQCVLHGEDGSMVTAIPYEGYRFAGWSDGVATAARTDTNVTGELDVTAAFVAIELEKTDKPLLDSMPDTVNTVFITITGKTEPGSDIVVTGGAKTVTGKADSNGNFSIEAMLSPNSVNSLTVTARAAGKTVSEAAGFNIAHESAGDAFYGDVTGSGNVSVADAIIIARALVGHLDLTPEQRARADVNGDGRISLADIILVARYVVGLIESFPAMG